MLRPSIPPIQQTGELDLLYAAVSKRIETLLEGCGFRRIGDLDPTKVAAWLAERREADGRFSAQTSNFYLDLAKGFCRWLVDHDRIARNPLVNLRRLNVAVDRRHDRRALSDEEFARLIRSAVDGPPIEGLPGPDRAMLYILATWTGFRRGELAALTRRSFDLGPGPATVRLPAAASKRRKAERLPLHPTVVARLDAWLAARPDGLPGAPIFDLVTPKGYFRRTSKMMKEDLERAGIPYRDEEGLFADFHASRHTFISNLSRAGVPLATAQKLARHSDPKLTANRYTHLGFDVEARAIASLPTAPGIGASPPDAGEPADVVAVGVAVGVAGNPAVGCRVGSSDAPVGTQEADNDPK